MSSGSIPLGMRESLKCFESLPDGTPLGNIAVESTAGEILYFWTGSEGTVLTCIVGERQAAADL
jgi:hypothetical protein